MRAQENVKLHTRAVLDRCQYALLGTKSELQLLSTLFEHLDGASCSAESLKGVSVTLSRLSLKVEKAIKLINEIY